MKVEEHFSYRSQLEKRLKGAGVVASTLASGAHHSNILMC